jgi:hypothetical protein
MLLSPHPPPHPRKSQRLVQVRFLHAPIFLLLRKKRNDIQGQKLGWAAGEDVRCHMVKIALWGGEAGAATGKGQRRCARRRGARGTRAGCLVAPGCAGAPGVDCWGVVAVGHGLPRTREPTRRPHRGARAVSANHAQPAAATAWPATARAI